MCVFAGGTIGSNNRSVGFKEGGCLTHSIQGLCLFLSCLMILVTILCSQLLIITKKRKWYCHTMMLGVALQVLDTLDISFDENKCLNKMQLGNKSNISHVSFCNGLISIVSGPFPTEKCTPISD